MPILKPGAQPENIQERSFAQRLKKGRVVPIISGAALADLSMGGHTKLTQSLSEYMEYPLPDNDRLVHIARYYKVQHDLNDKDLKSVFLNFIKNFVYYFAEEQGADSDLLAEAEAQVDDLTVSEFSKILGYPHFDEDSEGPLMILANLPIRVYLTTSPYTIIEDALRVAKKEPVTELCRWHPSLDAIDEAISPTYKPSAQRPLVYHLHGLDSYPESLVLTEDDHLRYLVNISQDAGNASTDRVHGIVRQSLSAEDLILLGFSLSDWAFRGLYAGLINTSDRMEDRGLCVMQLVENDLEKQFLKKYIENEAKFKVVWGEVPDFGAELKRLLQSKSGT